MVINRSNIAGTAGAVVVRSGGLGPHYCGRQHDGPVVQHRRVNEPAGSGAPLHVHHGEAEAF